MDLFILTLIVVFALSLLLFFLRIFKLYTYFKIGKKINRFDHPWKRFLFMIYDSFSQACSRRHKNYYPGFTHFIFFWGFILLFPSIMELILGPIIGFNWKFLGKDLYEALFFAQDAIVVLIVIALIMAFYRRYVIRPNYLENTFDSLLILILVTIIVITITGYKAFQIAIDGTYPTYMPLSLFFANLVRNVPDKVLWLYFFYWFHLGTILFFLVYIPYSKHMHIIASFPNIFFKNNEPKGKLTYVDLEKSEKIGANDIRDFTWKDYLDGIACTECGRCTRNCPAYQTEKPLNPKYIVHAVKYSMFHNAPIILSKKNDVLPIISEKKVDHMTVTPEELWACTTCGSCIEHCPVYNEHVQKIVDMRRYLVMTEGSIPNELADAYKNLERTGNPWGFPSVKRSALAKSKGVKTFKEQKAEYLLFMGCMASYDSSYRSAAESFIEILNKSGINFATLGNEESCCGDMARRSGNEYLFQTLAKKNIENTKKYGVKKIITMCPHGYNTIKNEYPQLGGEFEVYHYTQILNKLINEGKISIKMSNENLTYHDPCYLGRYNGVYDEPREILSKMVNIIELEKNREESFCCGGGSGRFLMEEKGKRINEERAKQIIEKNVNTVAIACPICKIMLEDAMKVLHREDISIKDINELILKNVEFNNSNVENK
ncbi:MAG: (Fe-S)-binding protein [Thermoplasmata archaeon]